MNKSYLYGIKTLIFDLDGTIYFRDKPIEGALEVLKKLRAKNYNLRFVTNTDSLKRSTILNKLKSYGIEIPLEEIFTCTTAAINYLKKQKNNNSYTLCTEDVEKEYEIIPQEPADVKYVIVGDFRDRLNFEKINTAFKNIVNGAEIIALHKSPYFYTAEGISIDTGAFVKMFEYASGKESILVGKPSKNFFELSLVGIDTKPQETIIIGDDLDSDIKGAKNFGAKSILVKTGKSSKEWLAKSEIKPDYIIDSVAHII